MQKHLFPDLRGFWNLKNQLALIHSSNLISPFQPYKKSCTSGNSINSNAGHKTSRRLILCPSGFIIFCLLKNLYTYQDISNLTQWVFNFPKTCTKSSKPQETFFGGQETFLGSIYSFLLICNKKGCCCLVMHCLNCVGSLKVLNNVTL